MIGIFSRTTALYNALADETRLSILILLRAKNEINLRDLRDYLGENHIETLEHHLNMLEKAKLIQKRDSSYSLAKEGKRRLSELGVTELEAIELTREREISMRSTGHDEIASTTTLDAKMIHSLLYPEIRDPETQKNSVSRLLYNPCSDVPREVAEVLEKTALYKSMDGTERLHLGKSDLPFFDKLVNDSIILSKSAEEEVIHDD